MNFKPESTNKSTIATRKWREAHPEHYQKLQDRTNGKAKMKVRQKQFNDRNIVNPRIDEQIRAKAAKGFSVVDMMLWFHLPESRIKQALAAPDHQSV